MEQKDKSVEIDALQRHLLADSLSNGYTEAYDDVVIYDASFEEMEENYVNYQTALWTIYSVLLILAWGIGLLMLLYLPVRMYICRRDFRSRKLYLTSNAIVYKVARPVAFPCLGTLTKEAYVVLPSVGNVIVEQGYLQSLFGIHSIRIEHAALRRRAGENLKIVGVCHPQEFQKAVLMHLSSIRSSNVDESQALGSCSASSPWVHSTRDLIFQKLEEVDNSVKKVQWLLTVD